jgi:hypothetical protein
MPPLIPQGRHWGHVTLLKQERAPQVAKDDQGNEYVSDTHGPMTMYFRCDCGRDFSHLRSEFPGRRFLRHCGHPDCEFGPKPKPRRVPGQKGQSITLYIQREALNQIYPLSEIWGISASATISEIIKRYLAKHPNP